MARRGIAIVLAIALLVVGYGFWFFHSTRSSRVPKEEAVAKTRQLVDQAGGSARVCEEAAAILRRFDTRSFRSFHGDDLNDFPAIASLKPNGVWSTGVIVPPGTSFIKVRVGNHFRGFEIHIFGTALDASTETYFGATQVDGCIYVIN